MAGAVRDLEDADVEACERILAALPNWFGMPETNREYIDGLLRRPSAVAQSDGRIVGFLSIESHNPQSAEIHVMAVAPPLHRAGIGSELVAWAERWCAAQRVHWLHVKTRGPSTPDAGYEKTRHFYLARGFEPLFETLDLWGPENAALIMIKPVAAPGAPSD
jgi:GNAT superfamily N-acetyltransferase